jgi:hypothetical protein
MTGKVYKYKAKLCLILKTTIIRGGSWQQYQLLTRDDISILEEVPAPEKVVKVVITAPQCFA